MSKIDENQNLSDDLQDRTPVKTKKHNDGDAAVWVFTLIILAAFVLLIVWATKSSKVNVYGNMFVEENYRYGSDSKAQLTLTNGYAAQGKEIVWLVDDNEVSRVAYSADADLSLDVGKLSVGSHKITAKLNDEILSETTVNVSRPLLTVNVPKTTITYGESVGELTATAEGWVDDDTAESVGFDGNVYFESSSQAAVGVYPLSVKFASDKYEVVINEGDLTVLPKELTFAPCQFAKVYDGTTKINSSELVLDGLINNDLVTANVTLEFLDKTVGANKKIAVVNCQLEGANSENYVVNCQNASFCGTITPLNITLEGVEAMDKVFDGTTSVTFANGGSLKGVLPSDKVSIGSINAHFVDAKRGTDKTVVIENVTLIGEDGENYVVTPSTTTADIIGKRSQSVTQSSNRPSTTPSLRLGHGLRVFPTFMV